MPKSDNKAPEEILTEEAKQPDEPKPAEVNPLKYTIGQKVSANGKDATVISCSETHVWLRYAGMDEGCIMEPIGIVD